MCMVTAVTEYPGSTEIRFFLSAGFKVNDGPAVVVMNVTVSAAPADVTGFQFRAKQGHVGIKKRF